MEESPGCSLQGKQDCGSFCFSEPVREVGLSWNCEREGVAWGERLKGVVVLTVGTRCPGGWPAMRLRSHVEGEPWNRSRALILVRQRKGEREETQSGRGVDSSVNNESRE